MERVLTLVAPGALEDKTVAEFARMTGADQTDRLGARAVDVFTSSEAAKGAVTTAQAAGLDAALQPVAGRKKRILISDMDSTIIGQECLDELADLAGFGEEIAAVTERAMRGELDFEEALIARVARLEGLAATAVDDVLAQRITLNEGARTLVMTMKAHGTVTALVSGGFTLFTGPVAAEAGFAHDFGNTLEIEDGRMTGRVVPPILGREAKKERLLALCAEAGTTPDAAIAMGDGANDLAMIELAGLGIAYHAKPVVAERAAAAIEHTDLTAALYYQGYRESEFSPT